MSGSLRFKSLISLFPATVHGVVLKIKQSARPHHANGRFANLDPIRGQ